MSTKKSIRWIVLRGNNNQNYFTFTEEECPTKEALEKKLLIIPDPFGNLGHMSVHEVSRSFSAITKHSIKLEEE